jgi:flagellar FliL protein
MKMIIIAVGAILVLGGGGAGAYFYFSQTAEAAAGAEAGEHAEAKAEDAHASGDAGGHGEESHVEFVELDPLVLPIVDDSGVSQVVSVVVALEVADAAMAAEVEKMSPRLKDAFIQDMYGVLNRHAALKGGVIQVSLLKERLNKISTKVMGENKVKDVLLQVVQQRPI